MATMNKLFMEGLKANYTALSPKNANTVYLCTDTRELYVGDLLFTGGLRIYTGTLPATPANDTLYYNETTGEGSYYTGTVWKTIIKPTVDVINSTANNDTIPTAKAVKDYVDGEISEVTGGNSIISDIASKTGDNGTLQITKGDDSVADVELTGVAHDVAYDSTNLKLTVPIVGSPDLVISLPQDNFVESGIYDSGDKEIILTLKDGSEIHIPAADLVDVYTSGSGTNDTISITVGSDNKISATIKVDTTGVLGVDSDGKLTIDLSNYATTTYVENALDDIETTIDALDERLTDVESALTWGTF